MKIDKHAYKVVDSFKKSLTKAQRDAIGQESFEELQILVEAALGETATKAFNETIEAMEKVLKATRKRTASIGKLEK